MSQRLGRESLGLAREREDRRWRHGQVQPRSLPARDILTVAHAPVERADLVELLALIHWRGSPMDDYRETALVEVAKANLGPPAGGFGARRFGDRGNNELSVPQGHAGGGDTRCSRGG